MIFIYNTVCPLYSFVILEKWFPFVRERASSFLNLEIERKETKGN